MRLSGLVYLIVVLATICSLTSSCRTASPAKTPVELSEDEIIEAAHVAARQHGYDPNGGFYCDIRNGEWMSFFVAPEIVDGVAIWPQGEARVRMHDIGVEREWPNLSRKLKGRHYQVVIYREWSLDTGLYVLVDKRTGDILFVHPED